MDHIRSGCVEMQWNPGTRLCFVRYHDGPKATAEDGRKLVAAITAWVGPQPRPFSLLVDGGKIQGGQPGYRGVMGAFFNSMTEFEGTGIGLATVQRVISRYDGHVWGDGRAWAGARRSASPWGPQPISRGVADSYLKTFPLDHHGLIAAVCKDLRRRNA